MRTADVDSRHPTGITGSSGQSLTETIIMLPVLILLLLGAFYMRELTATRIRATEAARYVSWENVWYVREQNSRNAAAFVTELRNLGLGGTRLKNVTILKRSLGTYISQTTGAGSQFFLPQALTDPFQGIIGGQGQNDSFVSNLAGGIGSGFDFATDLGGAGARIVHDAFGGMTNWDTPERPEVSQAVYTAVVTYDFKPSGPFFRIPPIQVRGFSSILSHPFAVVRSDNDTEFTRLFGDPGDIADDSGHIFPLWLFPSPPPNLQGAFGPATQVLSALGTVLNIVKQVITGIGGVFNQLSFGSNEAGWKMPNGTLKDFPEMHQKRQPNGNTSANGGNKVVQ